MARKSTPKIANLKGKQAAAQMSPTEPTADLGTPVAETPVRKTVAPKATAAGAVISPMKKAAVPLTHERIAERAYFISQSGAGGSEYDNWVRAENELKAELA
jgi:hypothetical protein